jgi:hypothetical protein
MLRSGLAPPLSLSLLALITALGAGAAVARADETDEPRSRQAQALFDRGRELMASGDVEQACALLAESQRLDPGGGTVLNLAVCHEKQGRLATAWTEYHDALSAAIRDDRKDRQTLATERIRALEPRLPHLVVTLPAELPDGAEVKVDRAPLSRLAAGAPLPVDPGPHEITATAPGHPSWSTKVAPIAEGDSVSVQVPAFITVPIGAAEGTAHLSTGSFVFGGVALAGYATMAITGAFALSDQSSANAGCIPSRDFCPSASAANDATSARSLAWASTVSLGVAVVATVLAVVWPRSHALKPVVGVDGGGPWVAF